MTDAQEPILYNVVHQRVSVDVDLYHRAVYGFTELTIALTRPGIKTIRLHSRQCLITDVHVEGKKASFMLDDQATEVGLPKTSDITQHHMYALKMKSLLTSHTQPQPGELIIVLPKGVASMPSTGKQAAAAAAAAEALGDHSHVMKSITVKVQFSLSEPSIGINFVGGKNSNIKKNFWHAYTTNSPIGLATSSWVPCIDGFWEPCTWQFEISVPRTVGNIGRLRPIGSDEDEKMKDADEEDENANARNNDDDDEFNETDLVVVCAEVSPSEVAHPLDVSKKVVSFEILSPTGAQHIGFAVGPFVQIPLPDFKEEEGRDADDMEEDSSTPISVYSFPDRAVEVQNTCIFVNKAIEYFSREFGSFPFPSLSFCFVSDAVDQFSNSAGLCICDDKLLYPPNVIEPIFSGPKLFSVAIASQWIGISIVPKRWEDLWLILGISGFMSLCFLRKLIGNNEYRFNVKKLSEEVCSKDIGMPPLAYPDLVFPLTYQDLSFLQLKAPVVLFILDRRMTKTDKSLGLSRAIPKILLQGMSGDLANSCLSTAHFIKVCERVGHNKLDIFFNQWVFGAGYPIFRVTQRFNKKRMFIEMGIRQVQTAEIAAPPQSEENFIKHSQHGGPRSAASTIQHLFTGPMTIRIHEADGTPYEHVVDLKDGFTKLDIQYNTKYKRLKRNKKPKEHVDVLNLDTGDDADLDGILLHCLGDVLQSDRQMKEWKLEEWTKEEEERMMNEAFEWIRVDTDFEWICLLYINQPDYMFASQLQQDRDVVAQYEAVRYFGSLKPSRLYSSLLIKTLMDKRYYYGIRVEAAHQLAKCGIEELDFIGKFHLIKAFQTMFCFENSTIPAANNFSDFTTYFIQKAIPMALSQMRDSYGKCPIEVCNFLLDLLRYNDNSSNPFSDSFYVCNLITAIVNSLSNNNFEPSLDEGDFETDTFVSKATDEIERCLRMDGWLPSVHNMITTTAIQQKERLWVRGYLPVKFEELIQYTKPGNYCEVRVSAFQSLLNLGGIYNKAVVHYLFSTIIFDNFEFVKFGLVQALGNTLGRLALRGDYKPRHKKSVKNGGGSFLVVEEDSTVTKDVRHDLQARATLEGALEMLRKQLDQNITLKRELWNAVMSKRPGLVNKSRLLDMCAAIVLPRDSYIVKLKMPRVIRLTAQRRERFNIVIKRQDALAELGKLKLSGNGAASTTTGSNTRATPKISLVAKKIGNTPGSSGSPKPSPKIRLSTGGVNKKQQQGTPAKRKRSKSKIGTAAETVSATSTNIALTNQKQQPTTSSSSTSTTTTTSSSSLSNSQPQTTTIAPNSTLSSHDTTATSANNGSSGGTNEPPASGSTSTPSKPKVKLKLRF